MLAIKKTVIGLICIGSFSSSLGQTKIDLSRAGKNADFSGYQYTRTIQTGSTLPATCSAGEFFFQLINNTSGKVWSCYATNSWQEQVTPPASPGVTGHVLTNNGVTPQWVALGGDVSGPPQSVSVTKIQGQAVAATAPAPGQILRWDGTSWTPAFASNPSSAITIRSGSTVVNSASTLNLTAGFGVLLGLTTDSGSTRISHSIDTAVVETRSRLQSGEALFCDSSSSDPLAYECALNPVPSGYSTGMVLHWRPDLSGSGGATTLKLNNLAPVAVKLADGITDPSSADIRAGELHPIWYDGTQFRLISSSAWVSRGDIARPACDATLRGRIWHVFGLAGEKDSVAVCAKDSSDVMDWQALY